MISIEFRGNKIQKETESYTLLDKNTSIGGSNIAYKSVDGETVVQNKKIRDDGHLKQYGITLFCSYKEKEILAKMMMGKNKTNVCNRAVLTINEGTSRDTIVNVVAGESEFYEESTIVEGIGDINLNPSEYGYSEDDVLYSVDILLVRTK